MGPEDFKMSNRGRKGREPEVLGAWEVNEVRAMEASRKAEDKLRLSKLKVAMRHKRYREKKKRTLENLKLKVPELKLQIEKLKQEIIQLADSCGTMIESSIGATRYLEKAGGPPLTKEGAHHLVTHIEANFRSPGLLSWMRESHNDDEIVINDDNMEGQESQDTGHSKGLMVVTRAGRERIGEKNLICNESLTSNHDPNDNNKGGVTSIISSLHQAHVIQSRMSSGAGSKRCEVSSISLDNLSQSTQELFFDAMLLSCSRLAAAPEAHFISDLKPYLMGYSFMVEPRVPQKPYTSNEAFAFVTQKFFPGCDFPKLWSLSRKFFLGADRNVEQLQRSSPGTVINDVTIIRGGNLLKLLLDTKSANGLHVGALFELFPAKESVSNMLYIEEFVFISEVDADIICRGRFREYSRRAAGHLLSERPIVRVQFQTWQIIRSSDDGVYWKRVEMPQVIGNCMIHLPNGVFFTTYMRSPSITYALALQNVSEEENDNISRDEFIAAWRRLTASGCVEIENGLWAT